jgi:hypothetical protein
MNAATQRQELATMVVATEGQLLPLRRRLVAATLAHQTVVVVTLDELAEFLVRQERLLAIARDYHRALGG